jgi:hypothetical protein
MMKFVPATEYAAAVCEELTKQRAWAQLPTDDKYVMRAVMEVLRTVATTRGEATVDPTKITLRPVRPAECAKVAKAMRDAPRESGAITITLVGETHRRTPDEERARQLLRLLESDPGLKQGLIIVERGMTYDMGDQLYVREETMTSSANAPIELRAMYQGVWGMALTAAQRSIVVAGYVLFCIGKGQRTDVDRVAIFFGENHKDILATHIEYLIRHAGLSGIANRPRTYITALSIS